MERDQAWLEEKFDDLWDDHFADVPQLNIVLVRWGKRSKRQLGSIRYLQHIPKILLKQYLHKNHADNPKITLITVTSLFRNLKIPEQLITQTLAHEICHYTHGYGSPLAKKYAHPHRGGVVRKELTKRGLAEVYLFSKRWLKTNWRDAKLLSDL